MTYQGVMAEGFWVRRGEICGAKKSHSSPDRLKVVITHFFLFNFLKCYDRINIRASSEADRR